MLDFRRDPLPCPCRSACLCETALAVLVSRWLACACELVLASPGSFRTLDAEPETRRSADPLRAGRLASSRARTLAACRSIYSTRWRAVLNVSMDALRRSLFHSFESTSMCDVLAVLTSDAVAKRGRVWRECVRIREAPGLCSEEADEFDDRGETVWSTSPLCLSDTLCDVRLTLRSSSSATNVGGWVGSHLTTSRSG